MNKKNLWDILCKYDNDKNLKSFCDSISKIIQGTNTEQDLVNIIVFNHEIENDDLNLVNNNISLTEILF